MTQAAQTESHLIHDEWNTARVGQQQRVQQIIPSHGCNEPAFHAPNITAPSSKNKTTHINFCESNLK